MNKGLRTVVSALALIMGGVRTASRRADEARRPAVPSDHDGKQRSTTNELVVCIHCEAECEATKACSAKSHAIATGWKKIDERRFLCPECRKEGP